MIMRKIFILLIFTTIYSMCNAQDFITYKDGRYIKGRVYQITETDIKYTLSGDSKLPMLSVPKEDLANILFEDGTYDYLTGKPRVIVANETRNGNTATPKPSNAKAVKQEPTAKSLVNPKREFITLIDGRSYLVTISEVTATEIKYKAFKTTDDQIYSIPRGQVYNVRYENGTVDFLNGERYIPSAKNLAQKNLATKQSDAPANPITPIAGGTALVAASSNPIPSTETKSSAIQSNNAMMGGLVGAVVRESANKNAPPPPPKPKDTPFRQRPLSLYLGGHTGEYTGILTGFDVRIGRSDFAFGIDYLKLRGETDGSSYFVDYDEVSLLSTRLLYHLPIKVNWFDSYLGVKLGADFVSEDLDYGLVVGARFNKNSLFGFIEYQNLMVFEESAVFLGIGLQF